MNIDFYKYLNSDDTDKIEEILFLGSLLGYHIECKDALFRDDFENFFTDKMMILNFKNDKKMIFLRILIKDRKVINTKMRIFNNYKLTQEQDCLYLKEVLKILRKNL